MRRKPAGRRVLIAGGGTGGHVYPGLSIGKELRRRYPDSELLFVGTERGLENRVIPGEGFRLERITVAGLKGMAPRRLVKNALALPKGM